ncbi:response regulator [candidate division CSSED10-310 bacterium]|uniref:Response regulator n=1 Tax=candidate division CSSED10-310 bacterium TaxID=2855610 RepID=A0ABV6Z2K3_UNCC1
MAILTVLLVDDELELIETLEERLMIRDIDAQAVTTGEEALKLVAEKEFDVVVLDVKMPGIGGLETLRRIKKIRPALPVILLTGHGSTRDSEEGIRCGAFDYVMKPLNIEDLIQTMHDSKYGREENNA